MLALAFVAKSLSGSNAAPLFLTMFMLRIAKFVIAKSLTASRWEFHTNHSRFQSIVDAVPGAPMPESHCNTTVSVLVCSERPVRGFGRESEYFSI